MWCISSTLQEYRFCVGVAFVWLHCSFSNEPPNVCSPLCIFYIGESVWIWKQMWCISSTSRSCRRSRIDFVWEWQAVPPNLVYSVYYTRINPRKWKILEKNEAKIQKNVKEKIQNNFVWQAAPPPLVVVNTSSTHLSTNITKKSQKTKKKKKYDGKNPTNG